jgi:hypothetical protein
MLRSHVIRIRFPYKIITCERDWRIRFALDARIQFALMLRSHVIRIRFALSVSNYFNAHSKRILVRTFMLMRIAMRIKYNLQLCDKSISRLRRHVKLSSCNLLMFEKLLLHNQ